MPRKLPFDLAALRGIARELRDSDADERPLVVVGARELAPVLARELGKGASPGALREGGAIEHPLALLYVLAGEPNADDLRELRSAVRTRTPLVCVCIGAGGVPLPQVPATNTVRVPSGQGFPIEEIGRTLARCLAGASPALAARVPALRAAICDELIRQSSRRGGYFGAATFVPGPDLPRLFLEQARLVLRLAAAHGRKLEPLRAAELAAVLAAGLGLRKLVRGSRAATAIPAWALQGSIAYAGTRAIGEGALRYFEISNESNRPLAAKRSLS